MKKLLCALAVLGILSACGLKMKVGNGDQPSDVTYYINDKKADDFYHQFIYKKIEGSSLPYHYLSSTSDLALSLGEDASGNKKFATVDLFLKDNGDFVFKYREYLRVPGIEGAMSTGYVKELRGKWHVDQYDLVVEGVGRGKGISINNQEAVSVKLDSSIGSVNVDKFAALVMVQSNQGVD